MDFWDRWFGTRWDARDLRAQEKYKRGMKEAERSLEKDNAVEKAVAVTSAISNEEATNLRLRF